jgi:SAF domain-containing protein
VKVVLVISARDNVATALQPLQPGQRIDANGMTVIAGEPIARGHKIALCSMAVGDPVIKYGSEIGTATRPIAAGAHVHTHNVASGRGRGDLQTAGGATQGRLAEPPDDGPGRAGPESAGAAATASDSSS